MCLRLPAWSAVLLLALSTVLPVPARADTIGIQSTSGPVFHLAADLGAGGGATLGWAFQVGAQAISVTQLGLFDAFADGLAESHQVGLWDSTGTLLAQTVLPAGTGSTLLNGYRYEAVAPVALTPGNTYVLGAFYQAVSNERVILLATESYAAEISYVEMRQSPFENPGAFTFPTQSPSFDEGFFGPNFQFVTAVASTPEPGTLTLFGAGVIGVIGAFRKRRQCVGQQPGGLEELAAE